MKAIRTHGFGGTEVLAFDEVTDPVPGEREVLIEVRACALNRADLLQRRGLYPPPPGATDILGLEMAGEVTAVGRSVTRLQPGDRVCALLPGGGYAEKAVIHEDMAIPLPDSFTYEQGAAIPEVFLTAYLNLFDLGGLRSGQHVLIHAGASGVGTAAIQLVREAGSVPLVTAGSEAKLARCRELGAAAGWNYREGDFAPWLKEQTDGRGVDLILDFIGAPYLAGNLASLAMDGRLIVVGTMGGAKTDSLHMGLLLQKRLQIIGTALRSRSPADKIALTKAFREFSDNRFRDGRMQPVIDSVFHWTDIAEAHSYMESNRSIGKIVLTVN